MKKLYQTSTKIDNNKQINTEGSSDFKHPFLSPRWAPRQCEVPFWCRFASCPTTMAAIAQRRSGSMRPGGLGSTQLIQKLAQLAWYWWPPYSSLKLSVSELNACQSERVKYYTSAHPGDRGIDMERETFLSLYRYQHTTMTFHPLISHSTICLNSKNRHQCSFAVALWYTVWLSCMWPCCTFQLGYASEKVHRFADMQYFRKV